MMGYENQQGFEEARLYASKEEMESLVLDDVVASSSSSNGFQSAQDPLSSSPPLVVTLTTTHDDPLHSPPSPPTHPHPNPQNPSSSSSSSAVIINSILEPPSYAEAVFRSFDSDQSFINGHEHSSPASPCSTAYLEISVSDPLKESDVTYYTYLITTLTNLEEYNGVEFSVRRRFRDVVTLSDRLTEAYRGFFIPVRPDKSVVESQVMQKNEFVEQRRAALEKYLRRLAKHPVIRRSEELRAFLTSQGKLPLAKTTDVASRMLDGAGKLPSQLFGESTGAVVDANEVAQPAKGGRDLLRIFKELKQSVVNDWGGTKPPLVEEDKNFLEKKDKLQDFEQQIITVSQQVNFSSIY